MLAAEEEWVSNLTVPPDISSRDSFLLEIRSVSGTTSTAMAACHPLAHARVSWKQDRITITHNGFVAEIDPFSRRGWLCRSITSRAALEVTLKVAMCSMLPLLNGVPLHAAAVAIDNSTAVFFGPSGAGKSTIASLAPGSVLSDELVAIREVRGFEVRATGFWETLGNGTAPTKGFPLSGLFELRQEAELRLQSISAESLMRKLYGVVIVPPAPPLWSLVIPVLSHLAESVPGYELGWAKESPPWSEVGEALRDRGSASACQLRARLDEGQPALD